jgi:2-iminobutanoate/2-iminopropanoate deaminase
MNAIQRYPSDLPYPFSKAVRAGGFVFLSGQIPVDRDGRRIDGDIAAQTRAVLDRIGETLQSVGADFADVVRVTVWLSDLAEFGAFNEVYAKYFQGALPARSTVQAKLALDVGVEIEVQAWVGDH